MSAPNVDIVNVSNRIISKEVGLDRSLVTFTFDVDVIEWTVRVVGTSHNTGILADSYVGNVSKNTEQIAEIDWSECYQEGENRVNIYGKSTAGQWTPYDGIVTSDNNTALTFAVQ